MITINDVVWAVYSLLLQVLAAHNLTPIQLGPKEVRGVFISDSKL